MNLQPLYDVKERLEYAAIAGTGLLSEDFRLQRAAENLKPLASASPVFAKIDASVQKLLSVPAEQRAGWLLDTLALVDAVVYTQASSGTDGQLEPLSYQGGGNFQQLSRGQLQPLLTALTTTGSGRMDIIKAAWENNPDYFTDHRVLPALVDGLGDSYGEISELNCEILKKVGTAALPLLLRGFDSSGKREMARRVEVIAAVQGADAVPWLKEILPVSKKDVRTAVIQALGTTILTDLGTAPENINLLLDLSKSERGKNREAVLEGLARQEGEAVRNFWKAELKKNGGASAWFLGQTTADWASDLVAEEGQAFFEKFFHKGDLTQVLSSEACKWQYAVQGKSSPKMLDFWRWMDGHWNEPMMQKKVPGQHCSFAKQTETWLVDSVCQAGKSPLCDLCRELWEKNTDDPRYLPAALVSAVLTRPPEEVFDTFAPFICTLMPPEQELEHKKNLHFAVIQGLAKLNTNINGFTTAGYPIPVFGRYTRNQRLGNLDKRWFFLLTESVWTHSGEVYDAGYFQPNDSAPMVLMMDTLDILLCSLADPDDPEICAVMAPYFRRRMVETGSFYAYGHMILRYHGSFVGVLEKSLHNSSKNVYAYNIWELFHSAAQTLSPQELADGLQEVLASGKLKDSELTLMRKAVPMVITLIEAGQPFPEWAEIWKMR